MYDTTANTLSSPQAAAPGMNTCAQKGHSTTFEPHLLSQNRRTSAFRIQNALSYPNLPDRHAREFLWAGKNTHLYGYVPHSTTSLKPQQQVLEKMDYQSTSLLSSQICRGKQKSVDHSASYQIQILLLSGKNLLQWVSSLDLVQDLKQVLEDRLGIPYAS